MNAEIVMEATMECATISMQFLVTKNKEIYDKQMNVCIGDSIFNVKTRFGI